MAENFKIQTAEDVAGLNLVKGFKVAGAACDIRNKGDMSRLDVALIVSDVPATASGVFTTNDVKAAPVVLDIKKLSQSQTMRAIVANSGNANACTGDRGMQDAENTCKIAADLIGAAAGEVLVCSTGRIGEFMPMQKLKNGISEAASKLSDSEQSAKDAARAIMTSDTRPKTVLSTVEVGGKKISVAGMAKGAGMIEPNMATMLAFIVSDAKISQPLLKKCLKAAADKAGKLLMIGFVLRFSHETELALDFAKDMGEIYYSKAVYRL